MNRTGLGLLACVVTALPARGGAESVVEPPRDGFVTKLADAIHARIDALIIARPPRLVPPTPIKRRYKLVKLASLDLGGPLAALAAADLDGDGKAELFAVTPREVLAIAADNKPRILGRVAFAGELTVAPPRDVVASVVADGASVVAAASPWQRALSVSWQNGALAGTSIDGGYPQCTGERAVLAPGRNFFGDVHDGHYGIRCSHAIDGDGYPLRMRAQLSLANKLDVSVERCAATGLACQPASRHEVAGVGIAFEVADVDRDGRPDLVHAAAGAPGDPDALVIETLGVGHKPKLRKVFAAGGVAGIAVADVDGNGTPDVVVAVRVIGASNVDLWRVE